MGTKISYKPQEFRFAKHLAQDLYADNESIEDNTEVNDNVLIQYIQATDLRKNKNYAI